MSPRDIPEGDLSAPVLAPPPRPKPATSLLVAMTGIGPFTMQILIPCLPALAEALHASYGTAQLTLTLYLAGVAGAQLIYGPLSDRYGRKPLLLAGLVLYCLGSLGAALAPSIAWLILARVVQAVGGCAGLVLGRAMIRDAYPREEAASRLGIVSTAMSVAPMVGPLLGSLLEAQFGWRAPMLACLVFGLPLLAAVRARLPETLAEPQPLPGLAGMLGAYAALLRLPAFRAYCGMTAFATGIFFAFAGGAPLVVIKGLGYSATAYAGAMMTTPFAWSAGTYSAARLTQRIGMGRMMATGTAIMVVGGALALLLPLLAPGHIALTFLPMALAAFGNGMTQPNAIACAISVRPNLAGTASGLIGAAQMGCGALMTVLCGVTETGQGLATGAWMLAAALASLAALRAARRLKA
ncbi:multidrug effflux MFS transporter [Belnapia sp. T6]|uniref:Bcr/CflA family efflux transporter n=1 Tax=Belnapia mucosa TaxID=2804532 RepID=A0ABS1VC36_9PROT|nr:multidrug effflux MFS transporter [Belnapia mucosa]MBL6459185.1 multidrug effflux MFS transporter [Belnapia mucosa]